MRKRKNQKRLLPLTLNSYAALIAVGFAFATPTQALKSPETKSLSAAVSIEQQQTITGVVVDGGGPTNPLSVLPCV